MKLQESTALLNLDDAFKEQYIDIVKRFYEMFESVYKYYEMLNVFLQDVNEASTSSSRSTRSVQVGIGDVMHWQLRWRHGRDRSWD